jgi:hypothetical protein
MPAAPRRQVAEIGSVARENDHLGIGAVILDEIVGLVILLVVGREPLGFAER